MNRYLKILKASAGSGKTHNLTKEYLILAFREPAYFSKILAVTFTNKAAEEMKNRVLEELVLLSVNPEKSPHYDTINNISKSLVIPFRIQERAKAVLTGILHNYSGFSISTIDSFTQKIIRAFSFEIGVHSGYRIELDNSKVISEVTEMLLERLHENHQLVKWLIDYSSFRLEEGKSWNFRKNLEDLSREIFKERFQHIQSDITKSKDELKEINTWLNIVTKSFEKQMLDYSRQTEDIIKNNENLKQKGGRNFNTIINYLTNKITESRSLKDVIPGKTVMQAMEDPEKWYSKSTPSGIKAQIYALRPQLNDILKKVYDFFRKNVESYVTARAIQQNFHAFGLLADIAQLLPDYRESRRLLMISDSTYLLREMIRENEAPYIYEKTGTRYNHILIDEFQDTSGFQWDNFRPLVENSLAQGFSDLIVGDVKQSIYRWRGGDWMLLLKKVSDDIGKSNVQSDTLDTNWRSRENIVLFNNTLFSVLPEILQEQFNQHLGEFDDGKHTAYFQNNKLDTVLVDAYGDVQQNLPGNDKAGGSVHVKFFNNEKGQSVKSWREQVHHALPELINELLMQGKSPNEIAILVRKNSDGREVADILFEYQQKNPDSITYNVMSADSLRLANSFSVRLIISAMKVLMHPGDKTELGNLVHVYRLLHNGKNDKTLTDFADIEQLSRQVLPHLFFDNYSGLVQKNIIELTDEIIRIFELGIFQYEFPNLRTFQETVYEFSKNDPCDINSFLEWWDDQADKINVELSGDRNAVQVLTIHKAKGLAFKVVIAPFCDWNIDNTSFFTAPVLWASTKDIKTNTHFEFIPVKYKQDLRYSSFFKDYFEEKIYNYMDALNALYVAFTRPREHLVMFCPDNPKITSAGYDKSFSKVSDLIKFACCQNKTHQENEKQITLSSFFSAKTGEFILEAVKEHTVPTQSETPDEGPVLQSYSGFDWTKKLVCKEDTTTITFDDTTMDADIRTYGILMHELLKKIRIIDDVSFVVDQVLFNGRIAPEHSQSLKNKLKHIVNFAEEWFSPDWFVYNERAIITKGGKARIPDRIIENENNVIVIDFKFGQPENSYTDQVTEYVNLIRVTTSKEIQGFLYYADRLEKIRIV